MTAFKNFRLYSLIEPPLKAPEKGKSWWDLYFNTLKLERWSSVLWSEVDNKFFSPQINYKNGPNFLNADESMC